jgi:hypothetical protein
MIDAHTAPSLKKILTQTAVNSMIMERILSGKVASTRFLGNAKVWVLLFT